MEKLHKICGQSNMGAQELYTIIASDRELNNEVLRIAYRISHNVESLVNAFIILGINTIRNIVLMIAATR